MDRRKFLRMLGLAAPAAVAAKAVAAAPVAEFAAATEMFLPAGPSYESVAAAESAIWQMQIRRQQAAIKMAVEALRWPK